MGGPCLLRPAGAAPTTRATIGPACTDNFQTAPFLFDGQLYQSVEQCYQAQKFADPALRERIRRVQRKAGENDSAYGVRVWQAAHSRPAAKRRRDFEAVKIEIMYLAMRAKYAQHPEQREDLLGTGSATIEGGPSTTWKGSRGRRHRWQDWNGLIQMRIREELRLSAERRPGRLEELEAEFARYLAEEGGVEQPLPGRPEELALGGTAPAPEAGLAAPGPVGAEEPALPEEAGQEASRTACKEPDSPEEEEQDARVRATFQQWDLDGDGVISKGEMARVLRLLCPSLPEEVIAELFVAADAKRDGVIDFAEFASWLFGEHGKRAQGQIIQSLLDACPQ